MKHNAEKEAALTQRSYASLSEKDNNKDDAAFTPSKKNELIHREPETRVTIEEEVMQNVRA